MRCAKINGCAKIKGIKVYHLNKKIEDHDRWSLEDKNIYF